MSIADRKPLATFFKNCREKSGFTQEEAATRLRYSSRHFLGAVERGVEPLPLKMVIRMMRLYGVKPKEVENILMKVQEAFLRKAFRI